MELKHSIENGVCILHLSGQFDYGVEKRLADVAQEVLLKSSSVLAIDVTEVESINSMGIAALFSVLKIVDEFGADFVIYGANPTVFHILNKVFENDFVSILIKEEFVRKYLS